LIDARVGRTQIRAISHSGSAATNQHFHPSGYTQNHAVFKQEEARFKKKAGGFTGGLLSTVQVKVTMVEPTKRGTKVTFSPVHQVTLFPITACVGSNLMPTTGPVGHDLCPANIEMETLRRTCIEKLRPMWDKWSHCYPIDEGDATVFADVPKGYKKLSGESCILEFFLKKTRGSTPIVEYNFALIPELVLHFSSAFYDEVASYREDKENQLQVCSSHVQLSHFPKPV